jgi:hypothetical protein
MDDLLNVYFIVDRLGPVLALLAVVSIFAAVRHSDRIKPENKADG